MSVKIENLDLDQYRFKQSIIPFRLVIYSTFDTWPYDKQLFSQTSFHKSQSRRVKETVALYQLY